MVGVLSHDIHFFRHEFPGLVQNFVGNRHLSNVVQKSSASDDGDLLTWKPESLGDGNGEQGYTSRMAFGLSILEIQSVAQSFEGDVIGALQAGHGSLQLIGTGFDE